MHSSRKSSQTRIILSTVGANRAKTVTTRKGSAVIDRLTAGNTLDGISVIAAELVEDIHERLAVSADFRSQLGLPAALVSLGEDILALGKAAEVILRHDPT